MYKSLFVKSRRDLVKFDALYEKYWSTLSRAEDGKTKNDKEKSDQKRRGGNRQKAPTINELKSWLYNGRISEDLEIASYSGFESITSKDFTLFLQSDHSDLVEIIRLLARRLAHSYNRRYVRTQKRAQIDLRSTIRNALRSGGDLTQIHFREKQKKKVFLNLICDVSKSMELYSQFLIEFMYHFQQTVFDLRTFVFSTKLVSLTRALQDEDYAKVLQSLSDEVPYWSGGTRIGASLSEFVKYHHHLLRPNSIVMIMSDGWDTGEPEVLEAAMKRIQKKSKKVIWLNPLAANPDYSPETLGMSTCMPYVDVFASVHNLDSLREVVRHLRF